MIDKSALLPNQIQSVRSLEKTILSGTSYKASDYFDIIDNTTHYYDSLILKVEKTLNKHCKWYSSFNIYSKLPRLIATDIVLSIYHAILDETKEIKPDDNIEPICNYGDEGKGIDEHGNIRIGQDGEYIVVTFVPKIPKKESPKIEMPKEEEHKNISLKDSVTEQIAEIIEVESSVLSEKLADVYEIKLFSIKDPIANLVPKEIKKLFDKILKQEAEYRQDAIDFLIYKYWKTIQKCKNISLENADEGSNPQTLKLAQSLRQMINTLGDKFKEDKKLADIINEFNKRADKSLAPCILI